MAEQFGVTGIGSARINTETVYAARIGGYTMYHCVYDFPGFGR
jgi:hypothetical protein